MEDIDSPNLYSFVAWQPHMATDPYGMCVFGLPCPEGLKSAAGYGIGFGRSYVQATAAPFILPYATAADTWKFGSSLVEGETGAYLTEKAEQLPVYGTYVAFSRVQEAYENGGSFAGGLALGEAFASLEGDVALGWGVGEYGIGKLRGALSMDFITKAAAQGVQEGAIEGVAGLTPRFRIPATVATSTPEINLIQPRPAGGSILKVQRELSIQTNRTAAVVDRWLRVSGNRWASAYRAFQARGSNFANLIRGRVIDERMRLWISGRYGTRPGVLINKTIPGSGNRLRPDLYFGSLGGRRVIFDIGGSSKLTGINKYQGMADLLIPIIY